MARKRQIRPDAGEGRTFVNSKAYRPHSRAARGTIKPAELNDAMKASSDNMSMSNKYGKLIRDGITRYSGSFKTGQFWQRLQSTLRKQYSKHGNWDLKRLQYMEVNSAYPMSRFFKNNFQFSSDVTNGTLKISLRTDPPVFRSASDSRYRITVFVIYLNYEALTLETDLLISELCSLDAGTQNLSQTALIPEGVEWCLICMKVEGFTRDQEIPSQPSTGMRILESRKLNSFT